MNDVIFQVLEKKEHIQRQFDNPRVKVYVHSGFKIYLEKLLNDLFQDITNVSELEDNNEYIKNNEELPELQRRVIAVLSDLTNAAILKPINHEFHEFVADLTIFFKNWNSIYNVNRIDEQINALVEVSRLIQTLPGILNKLQTNINHMEGMLNAKERNNPLTFKTSAAYLNSIKATFTRRDARKKEQEEASRKASEVEVTEIDSAHGVQPKVEEK